MTEAELMERLQDPKALYEHATIHFPYPLHEQGIDRLFTHLGDALDCRVSYEVHIRKETGIHFHGHQIDLTDRSPDVLGVKIQGNILPNLKEGRKVPIMLGFYSLRSASTDDYTSFNGFRFNLIPGNDAHAYHNGELEFMDQVKNTVHSYMKSQQTQPPLPE